MKDIIKYENFYFLMALITTIIVAILIAGIVLVCTDSIETQRQKSCLAAKKRVGEILSARLKECDPLDNKNLLEITYAMDYILEQFQYWESLHPGNDRVIMFGSPGFSYVYFIYGMYHCLNVVTEAKGFPAAVLIRGIVLLSDNQPNTVISGPGKLCKILKITKEHNNIDITQNNNFCICKTDIDIDNYICTPRIGISKGKEKFWRFVIPDVTFLLNIKIKR